VKAAAGTERFAERARWKHNGEKEKTMTRAFSTVLLLSILILSGCSAAGFKETLRGIAGSSTQVLVDTRPGAVSREFTCGLEECAPKVSESLQEIKTYVYRREGALTAVFVSEQDTTPVGIFLSSPGAGKTLIEVSSASTTAKETVAQKLFASLDKKLKVKKIDVQLDAVEEKK
jgi:hypothetical protein